MNKESLVPGIKFFRCKDCRHEWQVKVSNCSDRKGMFCPRKNDCEHKQTGGHIRPYDWESHTEWKVDKYGNVI